VVSRPADPSALLPGDEVEVDLATLAHGGHCVARYQGRVLFVRHGIPGERVRARVTEGGPGDRFLRADAVEVLAASPDRVGAPCRYAGPGECGGCDFQHVAVARQRELKAEVLHEQLSHLAHVERVVPVEALLLSGPDDGLGWRTRVEYAVDAAGVPGLRRHRSHDVVPVDHCLLATAAVDAADVLGRGWPGERAVDVVASSTGEVVAVPVPSGSGRAPMLTEVVGVGGWEGTFEVPSRGFWQVHPSAAATFVETVLGMLEPQPGETALDLYAGVGLFAAALADAVGETGYALAVESDRGAVAAATRNLADLPQAAVLGARVDDAFGVARPTRRGPLDRRARRPRTLHRSTALPDVVDLVVLDPPRTGAGRGVVHGIAALRPRAVTYAACDPAALARDTAYLARVGYALTEVRAFDAFPMTHHLETIACFRRES
jgi:tRNA/tmRNA/rRNA uracil-C5-methylase (TrmA/RlmC/RlmD family)